MSTGIRGKGRPSRWAMQEGAGRKTGNELVFSAPGLPDSQEVKQRDRLTDASRTPMAT